MKRAAKPAKKSTKKPASKRAAKPASKAKSKATKAAAKKSAKKPARKATKRAAKPAASAPAPSNGAATPIELEARKLMDADKNGDIDNVFDIVEELEAIRKGLPKTSELYPEWKRFYDDCCRIMGESVGM